MSAMKRLATRIETWEGIPGVRRVSKEALTQEIQKYIHKEKLYHEMFFEARVLVSQWIDELQAQGVCTLEEAKQHGLL